MATDQSSVDGPLRVVLDARLVDGFNGGVQQWVIGLAYALSALDDPAEEYIFLVEEGHDAWLRPYLNERCKVLVHRSAGLAQPASRLDPLRRFRGRLATWFPVLRTMWRKVAQSTPARQLHPLHRTIEAAGADVMHFTMQSGFPTSIPSIYQPWDLQHLHLPEFFTESERHGRETAYRTYCDQAALVVVATNWVKNDLVEQYGIEPGRVTVVNPPPVTMAYVSPSEEEEEAIAKRLGLPDQFLFYPAQTWGHKNHERLLAALGELRKEGIRIPLVFSGRLTERHATLIDVSRELRVADQLMWVGFVGTAEIQVIYQRATGLIFPSLYEGWGLPIVEAFATGLPVATSRATSLPELVGEAALLFDPMDVAEIAEAMRRLWTDADLRDELVLRGRARLASFDWRRTAELMRAHYRNVAGRTLSASDRALVSATSAV